MDEISLTLEISIASVLITFGGLAKMWYSIEKKLALQKQEIEYLKSECKEVKEEFEKLENEVRKNKEDFSGQYNTLTIEIGKIYTKIETSKGEVLQAIANIKK